MWQRQRLLLEKPTETINRNYQMNISDTAANQLIERYQLIPHPEGGWYRELHRSEHTVNRSDGEQRSALTMILFLLQGGDISRWHRVAAADETWHFIAGDALELFSLSPDGGPAIQKLLGFSLADAELKPVETLFVVDAMQGQDAANTAKAFSEALPLTGIVLTKLDGDSRGGAALSVRQITGVPIKFAGTSEKIDGLEVFDAQRLAGRVLGMGDIVALVEQVTAGVDMEAAQKLAAKVKSGGGFDLNDFLAQIQQMKQMGGLSSLMDKLPSQMTAKAASMDMDKVEKDIGRKQGIIHSMTPKERSKPELIKATRKRRIAAGAGVQVQDVNRMLKEFEQMQDMMKKMSGGGMMKMMKRMGAMKGMMGGGGFPGMPR